MTEDFEFAPPLSAERPPEPDTTEDSSEAGMDAAEWELRPIVREPFIPNLLHTVLFFVIAFAVLIVGQLATMGVSQLVPAMRREGLSQLATDARVTIPSQALQYVALLLFTSAIFSRLWRRPFWHGISWNIDAVRRHWPRLALVGLLLGLTISVLGNFLPMPKESPILNDLMHTQLGAWLMFAFGTTGAPLVEEMAFRGFLLPSLVNLFSWLERDHGLSRGIARGLGVPVSMVLTSLPFALLHSEQVSHSWAPIFLIGLVSIALCIVRLRTGSLAASTFVHGVYNFSLFSGMFVASDGFRHLEKLNS